MGMSFTLGELAKHLGATLDGDAARVVRGIAPLESAGADEVSFVTDTRYRERALASRAGAFLAGTDAAGLPAPTLRCAAPQRALIDLLELFHPPPVVPAGAHPTAVISPSARVDPTAWIGPLAVVDAEAAVGARARIYPFAYVGVGVDVGDECVLYPHVVLREGTRLGRRVIVHPGAVLGADGFGYAREGERHRKIPQVGGVRVGDDVEIGANTTIDRATFGDTVIGRGTKIDNLVQIGHNVRVGEDAILVAQVGVSGSCTLGRGVVLAGQVGVADHVTIGDGAMLGAQAGVPADVPAGGRYIGTPARPGLEAKRIFVAETKLPELLQRVRALEKRLEALEGRGPTTA